MKNFILTIAIILSFTGVIQAQLKNQLSNKNASREAVALYAYINDLFGKKTLSGQMFSGWGFDEISYVHGITGKYPAIKGFDFIQSSLNDSVVHGAIRWWQRGWYSDDYVALGCTRNR